MSEYFSLELTPQLLEVTPGQVVQARIMVENKGHVLDYYTLEVSGLDPAWAHLSEQSFAVFPGDAATATLLIHPPDISGAAAGGYEFSIGLRSRYFPSESIEVTGQVAVLPVYSFLQDLRPTRVTGRDGRFTSTINNTGNAELTFDLQGATPEDLCEFQVEPNPVTVVPQESLDVEIRAIPTRKRWLGKNKVFNITFTATPEQTPQVVTFAATLEAQPRLRLWHMGLAALLLLLLLVLTYSSYWAVFEREDLTYLRQETWPVRLEPFEAEQAVVFPILFHILPGPGVADVNPLPLHLRADVEWPDTGDVPLSLALILRDPAGNCWEHRHLARTAGPAQFPLFSGGTPCGSIEFNRLLLDHSSLPVRPARYAPLDVVDMDIASGHGHVHIEPVDQYCVRNDGTVIFDGRNPRLAAPHGQTSDEEITYWTLYVLNSNDQHEFEEPPLVSVRLKASVLDKGRTERDRNYALDVIAVPHAGAWVAASNENTCRIEWDDIARLGTEGKLIEGTVYVKSLEFCHRSDPACQPEEQVQHFVPDGESQLHVLAGHEDPCARMGQEQLAGGVEGGDGPAMICGDLLWDADQADTGTSAFVALRDPRGHCWTSLESKTVAEEDHPTPFAFERVRGAPCEEVLRGEILWYLVSWFPTDADLPQAAAYEPPVEPLVTICGSDPADKESYLLFDTSTVIPEVQPRRLPATTESWHLFVVNGSIYATDVTEDHEFAPRVSLAVKGDGHWRAILGDPDSLSTDIPGPVANCSSIENASSS